MNIAIICDVLGDENNGTSVAAYNLIRSLKEKGHHVLVVCCKHCDNVNAEFYMVKKRRFTFLIDHIIEKNGVSLAKPDNGILEEVIKQADVVHLVLPFKLSKRALVYAKKYNKPLTASFHCQAENISAHLFLQNFDYLNKKIYNSFYRKVYRNVDAIHYPTKFIENTFENIVGKTNAYVISNGVSSVFQNDENISKPKKYDGKYIILNIARLSNEKNQDIIIKAIGLLPFKNDILLILAGKGPQKEHYLNLAREKGVNLEINFYSQRDLDQVINYSDLYVHAASVEIESIACLQAVCCGLVPIIANSPKSAAKDFAIDERCLFENLNSESLAEKITYWYENNEVKKQLSQKYIMMRSHFDLNNCMDKMEQMFSDVIKMRNSKCLVEEKK